MTLVRIQPPQPNLLEVALQDLMGKEIKQGDYVAYAGRQSSSLWVNVGKVLKVKSSQITIRGVEFGYRGTEVFSRDSILRHSFRIVVVEPTEHIIELLKDFIPQMELPCTSEPSPSPLQEQSM